MIPLNARTLLKTIRPAVLLVLLGWAMGCAVAPWTGFPERNDSGPVWPASPAPARVSFVRQIHSHVDLFQTAGFWRSLGELVAGKPDTALRRPCAVALHPAGGLLIADPGRPGVVYYDWSRGRAIVIGSQRKGGLPQPAGVAGLPDGRILVSDTVLGTVEAFDRNGHYLGPFCAPGVIGRPAGIVAAGASGEVYVADVKGHCVRVFDLNGTARRTLGERGDAAGRFNYPTHLALDAQGRLLVADTLNFRVQLLKPDGSPVAAIGQSGNSLGSFSRPKGVAADSTGNLFVMEGLYDALQIFDSQGRLLLGIGTAGWAPGEFCLASGICYDPGQRLLFVADTFNQRVQVFRLLSQPPP